MKARIILIAICVAGLAFTGCDDDNFDIRKRGDIEDAFNRKYPDAQMVSWERERGGYYVADFWRTDFNAEAEAWFDSDADWHKTETDIPYTALPQTVVDAFMVSKYSDWRIDDVDMVERPDTEVVYVLDVEKNRSEYDLFFLGDGTLLKEVKDR